jgi:hypothetical protein
MKHLQDKIRLRRTGQQVVAAVRACFFPVSAGLALRHSPPTNTATTRPPPTATAPTVLWSRPEVVGGAMASWHPDEHLPRSAWPSPKPSQAVFCPLPSIRHPLSICSSHPCLPPNSFLGLCAEAAAAALQRDWHCLLCSVDLV